MRKEEVTLVYNNQSKRPSENEKHRLRAGQGKPADIRGCVEREALVRSLVVTSITSPVRAEPRAHSL